MCVSDGRTKETIHKMEDKRKRRRCPAILTDSQRTRVKGLVILKRQLTRRKQLKKDARLKTDASLAALLLDQRVFFFRHEYLWTLMRCKFVTWLLAKMLPISKKDIEAGHSKWRFRNCTDETAFSYCSKKDKRFVPSFSALWWRY